MVKINEVCINWIVDKNTMTIIPLQLEILTLLSAKLFVTDKMCQPILMPIKYLRIYLYYFEIDSL